MQGPVGVSEVVVIIVLFSFEVSALRGSSQRPTLVCVISGACWLGHVFFFLSRTVSVRALEVLQ